MKLLGPLHGFAAYKESQEEYQPEVMPPIQDIINVVRSTFQFTHFPVFQPQAMPNTFTFVNGRFNDGKKEFAVGQLIMTSDSDIVVAHSTEYAELVLEHLVNILDENFGYRLRQSHIVKTYLSNVVVTFDSGLEEYIVKLGRMADAINAFRTDSRGSFAIKRIAFGDSPEPVPAATDAAAIMERADFIIERRAGHGFEENRYFCSAPLRTRDHIRALEQIEQIARGQSD